MKRRFLAILSLILIIAMVFALPSCGSRGTEQVGTDYGTDGSGSDFATEIPNGGNQSLESDNETNEENNDLNDDLNNDLNEDLNDDNIGDDNTGDDNTGDDNTGDDNTGDDNTGDDNTGDDNTGDDNTGDDNTGDDNTGDDNDDEIFEDSVVVNSTKPVRNGNKVTFGTYPQSQVINASLISTLNNKANDWTLSNGMWYCDVENNGNKYRGVKTTESGAATWFKFELIEWTILTEDNGKVLVLCDMVIDVQAFSDDAFDYATSTIRDWLNEMFLNTAFAEAQQSYIFTTLVNNGSESSGYANNNFNCNDTNDKIFLLSRVEAKNTVYGFVNDGTVQDLARKKTTTEYALFGIGDTYDASNGAWWWLRTSAPHDTDKTRTDLAHTIKVNGTMNNSKIDSKQGGVVPAMWICFEIIENDDDVNDGGDDVIGGDDNTGDGDDVIGGDDNTGDGDDVIGGDDNTGDDNTGDDNTGDDNTGDDNTGDDNTGDDNDDEIFEDSVVVNSTKPVCNGNKVTFGTYPQSQVTNANLISTLNSKANDWTLSNGMWYCDVENNGNKYRGVKTTESGATTWFKFELIEWTILTEDNGKVLVLCDMVIDVQAFSNDAFDYATSTIRDWLNEMFLNTAFAEAQQSYIFTTLVNNGSESSGYANNNFNCNNTNDKIFLLSRVEAKNTVYGFVNDGTVQDLARKKTTTEYALFGIGDTYDASNGAWWWLRTSAPHDTDKTRTDLAHTIKINGTMNNSKIDSKQGGVVPAMWICFEIIEEPTVCAHTGGEATCNTLAVCDLCGESYGELNLENHKGELAWNKNAETHEQYYTCCGAFTVENAKHSGGNATCNTLATCGVCGVEYGNYAEHNGALNWEKTSTTHKQVYSCCGAVKVNTEAHEWSNGKCAECQYVCNEAHTDGTVCDKCGVGCEHSGGEATCKTQAICANCSNPYGALNLDNHTGTENWTQTESTHSKAYSCCGKIIVAEKSHEWDNGVCTECEYTCAHDNVNHVCALCGIALGHNYENVACTECGLSVDGNKVTFGSYPQSKVTDSALISTLNGKNATFTQSNGMWYADVVNGNEKYRGIKTSSSGTASWFKFEPISWTIVSRDTENNKVLILCDMIIDGSAYGTIDYTDELYNNNYENSLIREWLNSVFIETAFDTLQKEVIAVTTVDNTSKKVADYTNGSVYLSEANNTNDKVFLLSKSEAKNGTVDKVDNKGTLVYKYDCLTDADFSTAESRQKKVTEYAKAIGVYADETNNVGWWWLRTPSTEVPTNGQAGDVAHRVNVAGSTVGNNVKQFGGVVPAMWITL